MNAVDLWATASAVVALILVTIRDMEALRFEKNRARKLADTIRQKLGWEIVPVIASFDPKWDSKRRMWFEDILDPQESVSGEWNSFSGTSWIPNPAAIIDKLSSRY